MSTHSECVVLRQSDRSYLSKDWVLVDELLDPNHRLLIFDVVLTDCRPARNPQGSTKKSTWRFWFTGEIKVVTVINHLIPLKVALLRTWIEEVWVLVWADALASSAILEKYKDAQNEAANRNHLFHYNVKLIGNFQANLKV